VRGRALFAVVVAIYLFLLAPLLIVVAVSFDPTDAFRFPPPGVSLRWYAAFFASDTFVRAFFRVSLVIAAAWSASSGAGAASSTRSSSRRSSCLRSCSAQPCSSITHASDGRLPWQASCSDTS